MSVAKTSNKSLIKWLITVVCTAAVVFGLKDSATIEWNQTIFLAVTLFYILLTAFDIMNNMLVAILLPATYLFFNLADASVIYGSWSMSVVWLCVCGMIIGNVLANIGLLRRFVYWCVLTMGSGYRTIMLAFFVVTIVLQILCSSGGYIIFAAIVYTFCKALDLEGTKTGTGIMLAGSMISVVPIIYAPGVHGLISANASTVVENFNWDYVNFFIQNAPLVIPYLVMFLITPMIFKQDKDIDMDMIKGEYEKLGKMSTAEKKGLIIAILFVASVITTNIHGVAILFCFVLAAAAFYLPGINIGTTQDIKQVNYALVFFIASFISIGNVAGATKFTAVISKLAINMLGNVDNVIVICVAIFLITVVLNFVMTPLAMCAALSAPLAQIAIALSIPVVPVLLAFNLGTNTVLMPYEIAKFLIFYAYGLFSFKDFAKYYGIYGAMNLVFLIVVMVPYWKLIGIA